MAISKQAIRYAWMVLAVLAIISLFVPGMFENVTVRAFSFMAACFFLMAGFVAMQRLTKLKVDTMDQVTNISMVVIGLAFFIVPKLVGQMTSEIAVFVFANEMIIAFLFVRFMDFLKDDADVFIHLIVLAAYGVAIVAFSGSLLVSAIVFAQFFQSLMKDPIEEMYIMSIAAVFIMIASGIFISLLQPLLPAMMLATIYTTQIKVAVAPLWVILWFGSKIAISRGLFKDVKVRIA